MRLAVVFLFVSFPHLLMGQGFFADLEGVTIKGKRIAFDEIIEFEAECREVDISWPLPSPLANARLVCLSLEGIRLPDTTVFDIYAFGEKSAELELNHKYRISGRLSDAITFGGRTNLHIGISSFSSLGAVPPVKELNKEIVVDLTMQIGKQVELHGKLLSLNGVWWFEQGNERVILATEKGRSRKFEGDWHWRQVTVSGELKRQLRASLHQISLKTARDLIQTFVVFDSKVALTTELNQETALGGVLYDQPVKRVDGVFNLIAEKGFRRNYMGTETDARLFVVRNRRYLNAIIKNATEDDLDVVARRMDIPALDMPMRVIYGGILAARNDERGRRFLTEVILKSNQPDVDAMFVLGAFPLWNSESQTPVELKWAEAPALHCLKHDPTEMQRVSDILSRILLKMGSEAGMEQAIAHMISPPPKADPVLRVFGEPDVARSIASDLLSNGNEVQIPSDILVRFAKALPTQSVDYVHSRIAKTLFARDEIEAVEIYLPRIGESFWLGYIRENIGPNCLAEIKQQATKMELSEDAKQQLDHLLLLTFDDPAVECLRRINDPETSIEDGSNYIWDFMRFAPRGWETEVTAFVKNRILAKSTPKDEVQRFPLERVILSIGKSDNPKAVEGLISLFDCNFEKARDDWNTPAGIRGHIAAQLAEMTGESFGDDPQRWREYLESARGK